METSIYKEHKTYKQLVEELADELCRTVRAARCHQQPVVEASKALERYLQTGDGCNLCAHCL